MTTRKMRVAESKDHWNANGDEVNQVHSDSRSPVLDTIDKMTEPTACSLLDGIGINVELALAKVFPFQKACHSLPVQDGYVVVQPTYVWANAGHYPLPVPVDGGDITTLAEVYTSAHMAMTPHRSKVAQLPPIRSQYTSPRAPFPIETG
jgi:hypothetical protein